MDCLNLMPDGSSTRENGFIVAHKNQCRQMKLCAANNTYCLSIVIRAFSALSISVIVIKA